MTAIGFYHLTRSTAVGALARLLARTLAAGQRAVVLLPAPAGLAALDDALWEDTEFLPHGIEHAALQPVLLTADPAAATAPPNGAGFLFLHGGANLPPLAGTSRVFDLFDGGDPAAVAAARTRWQHAGAAGHERTYWREGPKGWEQGP